MALTSALPENFILRAHVVLNLYTGNHHYISFEFQFTADIPPKILRGVTKTYFREKHCFLKKGCRNMAV
jgi:hypothetical protein